MALMPILCNGVTDELNHVFRMEVVRFFRHQLFDWFSNDVAAPVTKQKFRGSAEATLANARSRVSSRAIT
jgi:hypothetical protein